MNLQRSKLFKIIGGAIVWILIIGAAWGIFHFRDSFNFFSEGRKTVKNKEQTQDSTSAVSQKKQKDTRKPIRKGLDDDDKDGLLNWWEYEYGTNPKKKDTDNDGYTDKEEIKNGYNPTGEGELTSSQKKAQKKNNFYP